MNWAFLEQTFSTWGKIVPHVQFIFSRVKKTTKVQLTCENKIMSHCKPDISTSDVILFARFDSQMNISVISKCVNETRHMTSHKIGYFYLWAKIWKYNQITCELGVFTTYWLFFHIGINHIPHKKCTFTRVFTYVHTWRVSMFTFREKY